MKSPATKLAALIFALPLWSHAVPVKNPDCARTVKINEVPGSSGAFFNETCTALYVLPPRLGSMTISGYMASPNIGVQCGRLADTEKDEAALQDIVLTNTLRLQQYSHDVLDMENSLKQGLIPVGQTADSMQLKIDKLMERMATLRTQNFTWQAQDDDAKLKFSKAEGGRGSFLIQSTFSQLLAAYRAANPGLTILPMVIDQSYLSINEQKPDDSPAAAARMPAVQYLQVSGVGEMPLLFDPSLLLEHKDLAPMKAPPGSKIFSDALAGEIRMSSIGACALLNNLGTTTSFKISDVKTYIAASATYSYQLQVTRKHKITYNLKELVKQLHEQTTRGGFLSSETINNFVDDRSSSTWIQFDMSSEDSRYQYTDEYIREVKKEFLDRALAQVIELQTGSPVALLGLIDPGKNGADTAAGELAKCPDVYCQIGAAGLKVLSSIFGSTSATASLIKAVSGEMTETVTEKRMVPAYGTYSFQ